MNDAVVACGVHDIVGMKIIGIETEKRNSARSKQVYDVVGMRVEFLGNNEDCIGGRSRQKWSPGPTKPLSRSMSPG
jgi:hypothetical protein